MIHKTKLISSLFISIVPTTIVLTACGNSKLDDFIVKLEKSNDLQKIKQLKLVNDSTTYSVYCHNNTLESLLKDSYSKQELEVIYQNTNDVRTITTFDNKYGTFIKASDNASSETNYNQIWVRDSLWGYKKLINDNTEESKAIAKNVLLSLLDYFSTPNQIARAKAAIVNPNLVLLCKNGNMNAIHIRFDASILDDVQVDGQPERWTHKQNDALGFLLSEVISAVENKDISFDDLNQANSEILNATKRIDTLIYLVTYLNALKFYQMADSGSWEENEAIRASSIGFVINGEEKLYDYLKSETTDADHDAFVQAYDDFVNNNNYQYYSSQDFLPFYIDEGYKVIKLLIDNGGECACYDQIDDNYRTADAALLNLIYPCNLKNLEHSYKSKILKIINDDLITPVGIKRYQNDNYQSANFWFNGIKTDINEGDTATKRKKTFIAGTEASWFFDSWYAISNLELVNDPETTSSEKLSLEDNVYKFLNRSIGQISQPNNYLANGETTDIMGFPESYNVIYKNNENYWYIASAINNLNWARAMFSILLNFLSN